jgi:hypothetical protein
MGNMTYAVAKYIPDLFRQEPRNVGVFVVEGPRAAVRLLGAREEDGKLDLRLHRWLQEDGAAYAEWFAYWRRTAQQYNRTAPQTGGDEQRFVSELVEEGGGTFVVWEGGMYVPEADYDSCEDVADILFRQLVLTEDEQEGEESEDDKPGRGGSLYKEVRRIFAENRLLANRRQLEDPRNHLIRVEYPIKGTLDVAYRPQFSQQNGVLTVMENVDFGAFGEERVLHHALATARMFDDIRAGNKLVPLELVAIVHWSSDRNEYPQEMGKASLASVEGLRLLNWDDAWERDRFVKERREAAGLRA